MHAYRSSGHQPQGDDQLNERLGLQLSEHRSKYAVLWFGVAAIGVFAVFAVAFTSSTVMLVLLLIAAVACAGWVGVLMVLTPKRVALYEHGLLIDRRTRRPMRLFFEDCRSVFYDYEVSSTVIGTRVTSGDLRLEDAAGAVLTLSANLKDAVSLFRHIDRVCVKPVAREAHEAYHAGEVLRFGAVALSTAGLGVQGELEDWSNLRKVQVSPKGFWFHLRGRVMSEFVAFGKVPYAFVLVELLEAAGCELEFIEGFARRPS